MTEPIPPTYYEFKATDADSFELTFKSEVKNRILKTVINQSQKAIRAKTGQFPQHGKIEELLNKHILPPNYNNLIHTLCKPVVKDIYKEIEKDGIKIIRDQTDKVEYTSENNQWWINVTITGTYSK